MKETLRLPIGELVENPENPRFIKDDKFKSLVQSLKDFPEMAEVREVVVNMDKMILGGNMRYKAMKEAGWKEVPVKMVDWSIEKQREFVIKDNISGGDWDWDSLANQYEPLELDEWGLDLPKSFTQEDNGDDEGEKLQDKKELAIEFENEEELEKLYAELTERGYKCRVLTL